MAASASSRDGPNRGGGFFSPEIHLSLMQALEAEKGLGATFLEKLYCLVKELSSILSVYEGYLADGFSVDLSTCGPVIYDLIFQLSNWAFEELRRRFERFFFPGKVAQPVEAAQFHVDQCVSSSSLQDFCVLLRCCITMLHVLEFDFNLCLEKSQILVKMLRELCSTDAVTLFLQQKVGNDRLSTGTKTGFGCSAEDSNASIPFACLILEVIADELLLHQSLRKHLAMTYCVVSTSEKIPAQDCLTCEVGIILELVCAHFLLSSHEETAFGRLFHLKFCCKMMGTESPKLSLTAALLLLRTPALFSAPYMLQSHTLLLVSRCVTASKDLNLTAMTCYMSAFEQSVILYTCHLSHLPLYGDLAGAKCQSRSFVTECCMLVKDIGLPFDWYVQKVTYDAVNVHSQKLAGHCSKQSCIFLSRTKAETVNACMTYVKNNRHFVPEQWRDDACLILNCIIQRIAGESGKGPLCKNEVNWQDIYYGAALLNLMGYSLLQIVTVLSEHSTKTLNDYIHCGDYEFISGIIDFFRNQLVGQYVLCDMQAAYSLKQKRTMLMLAHFISMLFYSIDRRLYPLWEGCIFVMIAVMNLLVFEEGNLDSVRKMCGYVDEISSSHFPASKISSGSSLRRSSIRIASDFQKIQLLHSKKEMEYLTYETSRDADQDLSSEENDKCNGEAFLKCVMEDHNVPDWDDLANFIEATPGKDYARCLKNRESYNEWKHKKKAVGRHQRKRMLHRKITKWRWLAFLSSSAC